MAWRIVASGGTAGLVALTAFNRPVYQAYAELEALLRRRLGPDLCHVLTRPSAGADEIQWLTEQPGPIVPVIAMSAQERRRFDTECTAIGERLAGLVLELAADGPNTRLDALAQILNAALEVPGVDCLYSVDGRPALVFWAFRRSDGAGVAPLASRASARIEAPVRLAPRRRSGRPRRAAVLIGGLALLALASGLLAVLPWSGAEPGTTEDRSFGSRRWTAAALTGDIFFLSPGTSRLPDLDTLKSVGRIYARVLNVPPRSWTVGFPGITDRFEWFAVRYTGRLHVNAGGRFVFRLVSDDGAILSIDRRPIIDNDGLHTATSRRAEIALSAGEHAIRVDYFQGPRVALALQLFCAGEDTGERVFPDCGLSLETPSPSFLGFGFW